MAALFHPIERRIMRILLAVLLAATALSAYAAPLPIDNGIYAPLPADEDKDKDKDKKDG
jgi:hypothetical protein